VLGSGVTAEEQGVLPGEGDVAVNPFSALSALTKIGASATREADRFVDSGVLRQMTSVEVCIPDFIGAEI